VSNRIDAMPTKAQLKAIDNLIRFYQRAESQQVISTVREQVLVALRESAALKPHIHSMKSRIKSPERLRNKLVRKLRDATARGRPFDIPRESLFTRVGDLVGIRLLHLHTRQFEQIDGALREIFDEQRYRLAEKPFARTWDDEYRAYFSGLGIRVQSSPTMYTSVHYSIEPVSRTRVRCEIQVRTLMEEVWGEVDHTFNYPEPTESVACSEQIKALARATSSATRLVDAIFLTASDLRSAGRGRR
jgi:putative GTP pyrophosphokinase